MGGKAVYKWTLQNSLPSTQIGGSHVFALFIRYIYHDFQTVIAEYGKETERMKIKENKREIMKLQKSLQNIQTLSNIHIYWKKKKKDAASNNISKKYGAVLGSFYINYLFIS